MRADNMRVAASSYRTADRPLLGVRTLPDPPRPSPLVKRVVDAKETRPFDPMLVGVGPADWLRIQPEVVTIADLVLVQKFLAVDNLLERAAAPDANHGGDEFIHVCAWDGELWVKDGHHRTVIAAIQGKRSIGARVLRPAAIPGTGVLGR